MQISHEAVDDTQIIVRLAVEADDYEPKVEQALKDVRKKAQIPGFRKGMVPLQLLRKMHGEKLMYDAMDELVREGLFGYLKDNNIRHLYQPILNPELLEEPQADSTHHFAFDVAVVPPFEMPDLTNISVVKQQVVLQDEDLDMVIEDLRTRYGEPIDLTEHEGLQDNDVLQVELAETDENGEEKTEGVVNTTFVSLRDMELPDTVREQLTKLPLNESITLRLFEAFPNRSREQVAKQLLGVPQHSERLSEDYRLTLKKITRRQPAQLDAVFFEKMYPNDALTSEETFRERVREDMNNNFVQAAEDRFLQDVRETIVAQTNLPLSDNLLRYFLKSRSKEKELTDEQVDEQLPNFTDQLRWTLIAERFITENSLQVTEDEIEEQAYADTINMMGRYGMYELTPELEKYIQNRLHSDEDYVRQLANMVANNKINRYLLDNVVPTVMEVSRADFNATV